jgi:hypothetical protein
VFRQFREFVLRDKRDRKVPKSRKFQGKKLWPTVLALVSRRLCKHSGTPKKEKLHSEEGFKDLCIKILGSEGACELISSPD